MFNVVLDNEDQTSADDAIDLVIIIIAVYKKMVFCTFNGDVVERKRLPKYNLSTALFN